MCFDEDEKYLGLHCLHVLPLYVVDYSLLFLFLCPTPATYPILLSLMVVCTKIRTSGGFAEGTVWIYLHDLYISDMRSLRCL